MIPACQANSATPDNQSIRRQFARLAASHPQKIFLCGLTAPSPIFIFSREGINLTAKWSPTNTTHFKAAGTALEKPAGFFHSYFQSETQTLPSVFQTTFRNPKNKELLADAPAQHFSSSQAAFRAHVEYVKAAGDGKAKPHDAFTPPSSNLSPFTPSSSCSCKCNWRHFVSARLVYFKFSWWCPTFHRKSFTSHTEQSVSWPHCSESTVSG